MNELFEAVDAVPDVRPSSQFVKRIRGKPKDQPPPITKTLNGRARRWMIDPDWLRTHPEFDVPNRIADSGRLWGDANDPEETEMLIKQAVQDKIEMGLKRKHGRTTEDGGGSKARKRAKKGKAKEATTTAPRAGGSRIRPTTPATIEDDDSDSLYN